MRRSLGSALTGGFPRWSPDGRWIACMRAGLESVELALASPSGGDSQVVTRLGSRGHQRSNSLDAFALSWMRDGSSLVVADRSLLEDSFSLYQVSVASGARSKLTSPPPGIPGDTQPTFSPDGRWLAFVRHQTFSEGDVYLMPVGGGTPTRLTQDNARIEGLAWLPDSSGILFASNRALGFTALWQVDLENPGIPKQLAGGAGINYPSSARFEKDGSFSLVYQFELRDSNVWTANLHTGISHSVRLSPSAREDYSPQLSFDGAMVAFVSNGLGFPEGWVCDKDGANLHQVTSLKGGSTDSPRWSPDGAWIAFTSRRGADWELYIVPSAGGEPRVVAASPSEEGRPSFSHDGRWLYFCSDRTGRRQLWKVAVEGGTPVQLTQEGGYEGFESLDGKWLYYVRDREHPALWQASTSGGQEKHLLDGVWESRWAVARDAIYFQAFPGTDLRRYDLRNSRVSVVGSLGDGRPVEKGLAIGSDGKTLAWTQLDQLTTDLVHLRLPGKR